MFTDFDEGQLSRLVPDVQTRLRVALFEQTLGIVGARFLTSLREYRTVCVDPEAMINEYKTSGSTSNYILLCYSIFAGLSFWCVSWVGLSSSFTASNPCPPNSCLRPSRRVNSLWRCMNESLAKAKSPGINREPFAA
jgi:hypothetical protein